MDVYHLSSAGFLPSIAMLNSQRVNHINPNEKHYKTTISSPFPYTSSPEGKHHFPIGEKHPKGPPNGAAGGGCG
jgi:hypothetical protein